MFRLALSGILLTTLAALAVAATPHPSVIVKRVETPHELCRDNLNQYVSCTPGGAGNLVCSATCGAGAVCLAIDFASHGRCHVAGSREP